MYRKKQYRSIIIIIINDKIYDRITKASQRKWKCKNWYNFDIGKDYTHFGTLLTNKCELRPEIEKIITNANRAYYAPIPLLKIQSELRAEKIETIKTLIRPVATYGATAWTLNKDISKRLAAFERKVLRRIFGGNKSKWKLEKPM